MTLISKVDIPNILENLQKRFLKDIIYVSDQVDCCEQIGVLCFFDVLVRNESKTANATAFCAQTNIGDVLVSMNPFYLIPGLYDDSVIHDYCGKSRLELPPHMCGSQHDTHSPVTTCLFCADMQSLSKRIVR
jgi:hypothetical protein